MSPYNPNASFPYVVPSSLKMSPTQNIVSEQIILTDILPQTFILHESILFLANLSLVTLYKRPLEPMISYHYTPLTNSGL